jgi:hypothetical protein
LHLIAGDYKNMRCRAELTSGVAKGMMPAQPDAGDERTPMRPEANPRRLPDKVFQADPWMKEPPEHGGLKSGRRFNQCITLALPAGMTDRLWGIYDIVAALENWESQP